MKKKVLVLGSGGMLGQALVTAFEAGDEYSVAGWDRAKSPEGASPLFGDKVDVTDTALIEEKIRTLRPDILINATGHNGVDRAEEDDGEYRKALLLNADVPGTLARMATDLGALFVHFSSDYVFGQGKAGDPGFAEEAFPHPECRYAETKLLGEQAVQRVGGQYYLVRLSKLFGISGVASEAKKSFFETMLELAKNQDEIRVVDSEQSCFTYAPDLARAVRELIESGDPYGIYHLPNSGPVTWYQGVLELYRQAGVRVRVVPVEREAYPRPAKRPECSVLLNTKRPLLRSYREALGDFLRNFQ